jgi:hypothetical protein
MPERQSSLIASSGPQADGGSRGPGWLGTLLGRPRWRADHREAWHDRGVADEDAKRRVAEQFQLAQARWRGALKAHRLAPPDPGYAGRLAELAAACRDDAAACRAAQQWFEWPAVEGKSEPPYELRPGTGRRGPAELWERFDAAIEHVNQASAATDLAAVADAFDALGAAAEALSVAVEQEDRAAAPAARRRRSA